MGDKILMPTALTAENGAKAALIGEYHETLWVDCPECFDQNTDDQQCEMCHDEGGQNVRVDVSWITIKKIYKDCVELFREDISGQMEEKPTELPGERYRIKLSGDDIYVFISYNNGIPWEVFATVPCSWLPSDPRKGYMGAINRLAALSLQSGIGVEKVVSQLTKSSAGDGDYSGILAGLLERREGK
jgi:hypothetical protein